MYLLESNLPEKKSICYSLSYIYGLGTKKSLFVCKTLGFSKNLKINDLTNEQINKIITFIPFLKLELASDLKKLKTLKMKKLIHIKSYKGLRKNQGFPIRGQRTHTNGKTARKKFSIFSSVE
jgi:small subunit ribosomal protein S13